MNAIEENRHNIQANLAAIDAATAAVISKTSGKGYFFESFLKKFKLLLRLLHLK